MKALVKLEEGPGKMELLDVPEPEIEEDGDVLIKIRAAGICGTDLAIEKGTWKSNPPVIMGHEFSGVVEKIGRNVKNVRPGDRVVAETAKIVCGSCHFCNTGALLMCRERLSIGYGTDGAFTDWLVTRAPIVHKIPDSVSFEEAALAEPAAVAVHAVMKTEIKPGDFILVTGPGTIGLLCGMLLKSMGAIVAVSGIGQDEARLKTAERIGIDYVINSQEEDLSSRILTLTKGLGCDAVFECSGAAPAVDSAIAALKNKGSLVQVGLTAKRMEIEYSALPGREISLIGSFGHSWQDWEKALQLMELGMLKVGPLVTHTYVLPEWERAFAAARQADGIKVLLYPEGLS